MQHEYLIWIATFAYAIHAFEEFELNWRDWARSVLGLPVDWTSFYIANSLVIVLGICCGSVGWKAPWFTLGLPALMVINATLFHVVPTIAKRVYSPGLATAMLLFYPLAAWIYYGAWQDGVLTTSAIILSTVFGAAIMATPIILLRVKSKAMFQYDRRSP